jgi:hypothetical protein
MNPIYGTKILPLRWFANYCNHVATKHLTKAINIDEEYLDKEENLSLRYKYHSKMWKYMNKPYEKWGTTYEFDINAMLDGWKKDPEIQELMEKLGSDYDKNGTPYWNDHEVNCACTKCMP